MPLAQEQAASLASVTSTKQEKMVTSKKGGEEQGEDMEMREDTSLATVAEVEMVVGGGDVEAGGQKGKKDEAMVVEEGKGSDKEMMVHQCETWTSTLLQHVGNYELEWLGEDLALPILLMSAMLLQGYEERAAGIKRRFRRKLERVRKELLEAKA
ncbi:hypothetical protein C0989_005175, partial [Termitomyces sp. Mn162]